MCPRRSLSNDIVNVEFNFSLGNNIIHKVSGVRS